MGYWYARNTAHRHRKHQTVSFGVTNVTKNNVNAKNVVERYLVLEHVTYAGHTYSQWWPMRSRVMSTKDKVTAIRRGERVITNDEEMDAMLVIDEELHYDMVSIINPDRVGLLDKYIAWVK